MTMRRLYRPFTTSELVVLPLPTQGREDTFSRRLPVAVGSEEGVETIPKLNKSLDLEIRILRSCLVEQQGKLARERSLALQLESNRHARTRKRRDSAVSLDRESQGVFLDPSLPTENRPLKADLDSSRREKRLLLGRTHSWQQECGNEWRVLGDEDLRAELHQSIGNLQIKDDKDAEEANVDRRKREKRQLQGRQEAPGARTFRSRSPQGQEPSRTRTSCRKNALGRESPATGASEGGTIDAEDAKDGKDT